MDNRHENQSHINNLKKFAYLFIVDLVRLPLEKGYATFLATEKDYGKYWLQAYLKAFQENNNGKMTHDLIKGIHKIAMGHKLDSNPGEYRKGPNYFSIISELSHDKNGAITAHPNYSVTPEGIKEFIQHWLLARPDPIHLLSFDK